MPRKALINPDSFERYRSPLSRSNYRIPLNAVDVGATLSSITEESLRYELLDHFAHALPENEKILQRVVDLSYAIARSSNKKNYAAYKMCDTLIDDPSKVMSLLERCLHRIKPIQDVYYESLRKEKERHLGGKQTLNWWDISLYDGIRTSRLVRLVKDDVSVFSAQGILNGGIIPLLDTLFDIQLQEVPIEQELLWTQKTTVQRYRVIHGSRVITSFFSS